MNPPSLPWRRRALAVSATGLLAGAAIWPAAAATRSSANYSIVGDAVDLGGGTVQTSAAYSVQGSALGQTTAPLQSSAAYALKSGFVGQLYDVRGLGLAGAPVSVDEGKAVQLIPAPLLDDGTLLAALAPSSVTWAIANGPLVSVSTAGVATAGIVYQTTPATVRLTSASLSGAGSISVRNVNTDDYGSYAGDGIDDSWQVMYFGLNNPAAGPTVDADGTGQSNLFKYLAGLNPLDPTSRFTLTISLASGQPTLTFAPVYGGRTYTVQSSPTLAAPAWTTVTNLTPPTDSGATRTVTDLSVGASGSRFYRLLISIP